MGGARVDDVSHEPKLDIPITSAMTVGEDGDFSADEKALVALGYKPELRREFGLWTTFSVSFAVLGLLPSFASTLYDMGIAGTAGMVWGWLIAGVFIQCVGMSMAELCSSMPTSGGVYYVSAVLAPRPYGPLAAWITGWSNWIALVTYAPAVDHGIAGMILAATSINRPAYTPADYQIFLLTVLLLVAQACICSMPTKWLARFNSVGSSFNFLTLLAVIVMIPVAANREAQGHSRFAPSSEVWVNIYKGTSVPSGVAILMTSVAAMWTMAGYDAPFYLTEECSNANIACPRAMVLTTRVGAVLGWFLSLIVAYSVIDIQSVMSSPLGQPWAAYLLQVMPKKLATTILALTIICGFCMGQGCMISASRVSYACSRDGCLPGSHIWRKVNKHTQTPVNAVCFNTAVGICLVMLIFAGPVAIGAVFSIGAVAAYVSFSIPIFIRTFLVRNSFRRGPWHLGRFGIPIGALSCAFVAVMIPIMCLPSVTGSALEPSLMNWTCLVYGAPMMMALIWWILSARKWFKGPNVSVEHYIT